MGAIVDDGRAAAGRPALARRAPRRRDTSKLAFARALGHDRTVPAFRKPAFAYDYDVDRELEALRTYPEQPDRADRAIPPKAPGGVLIATWNIANLGLQRRDDADYRLLAEVLGWFDLVAIQEVNDDLGGIRAIQGHLPDRYRVQFNDTGGNRERFAFLYDAEKVIPREVTVTPLELDRVRLEHVAGRFAGFDRNPMIASFQVDDTMLLLASVHLYFGDGRPAGLPNDETGAPSAARAGGAARAADRPPAAGIDRRVLEAYAIARWAAAQHRSRHAYTHNVIALGDFNLPVREPGDHVYDALVREGLHVPAHSTHVGGSNLNGDAHYDQMAVFPGAVEAAIERVGIFDFDGAVFRDLWGAGTATERKRFQSYVRFHLSDHRPLWMEMRT
jgi:endonuclease/exonuclease/phosphatase family metal-dependent hydrolase